MSEPAKKIREMGNNPAPAIAAAIPAADVTVRCVIIEAAMKCIRSCAWNTEYSVFVRYSTPTPAAMARIAARVEAG